MKTIAVGTAIITPKRKYSYCINDHNNGSVNNTSLTLD